MNNPISRIAVLGGTHGNERIGVYLAKWWQEHPLSFKGGSVKVLLSNPAAVKENRRYIDQDLNRSFSFKEITSLSDKANTEQRRAYELNKLLGPKGDVSGKTDFIIDLHSSTAAMGVSIIIADDDPLSFLVAHRLKERFPELHVVQMIEDFLMQPYITSLAPHAITIEVGPIPQGVLHYDLLARTKEVVENTVEILKRINTEETVSFSCELFDMKEERDYPRDKNGFPAFIHPEREGKDFMPLKPGDPLFITMAGDTIPYNGEEICYPFFINEAAYYEKGIALMLAKKIERSICYSPSK